MIRRECSANHSVVVVAGSRAERDGAGVVAKAKIVGTSDTDSVLYELDRED